MKRTLWSAFGGGVHPPKVKKILTTFPASLQQSQIVYRLYRLYRLYSGYSVRVGINSTEQYRPHVHFMKWRLGNLPVTI